jgi:hypothetical protein
MTTFVRHHQPQLWAVERDCLKNRMRRSGAPLPPSGGLVEQPDSQQYPAREKKSLRANGDERVADYENGT